MSRWTQAVQATLVALAAPLSGLPVLAGEESPGTGRGFTLGATVTVDGVASRRSNGDHRSGVFGLAELAARLDTGGAGLWQGGTFAATINAALGRRPSSFIGDLQGTSNIEAANEVRIYEAWYRHAFRRQRSHVQAGILDLNTEFNLLDGAALFVNSSFGITPELSQVEPSIFPKTGLGLHVRHGFGGSGGYILAGAYNAGVADRLVREFPFRRANGFFYIAEGGVARGDLKAGVGVWSGDRDFTDFAGTRHHSNAGIYAIGEGVLRDSRDRAFLPFLQLGWARDDRNQISSYGGAGLQVTGWVPGAVGIAVARAEGSSAFDAFAPFRATSETVVETTWSLPLGPRTSIQPDIQYVMNPGLDAGVSHTWVATLRLIVRLRLSRKQD